MSLIDQVSWYKKYQPKTIDEYVFESEKEKQFANKWIEDQVIPGNLLMYGSAGTGKSSLAHILIKSIIKDQNDYKRLKDKGVKSIEALDPWLNQQPVRSLKKVVFIEEIDRCSSEAFNKLKDDTMEHYQNHVIFIATTNHIRGVEHAVLTRFNYQFNLGSTNLAGTYTRLANILNSENVQWTRDGLKVYVENNIKLGLREMINGLQYGVVNGEVDFSSIVLKRSQQEEDLINNTLMIIDTLCKCTDVNERLIALQMPMKSIISNYWSSIVRIINYNYELNYEIVFMELYEKNQFGPLLPIIDRYVHSIQTRKYPHAHYQAFLYEMLTCIMDIIA